MLNRQALLDKFLGKEISLTVPANVNNDTNSSLTTTPSSPTSSGVINNGTSDNITGRLLAFEGENFIISSTEGQIHVLPSNTVSMLTLPFLPSELVLRPTLIWKINNTELAGDKEVEVSYLTRGISWNTAYVAVANGNDSAIDVNGWITLDNQAGTTFKNATMRFLSGDVNIEQPLPLPSSLGEKVEDLAFTTAASFS